MGFTAAANTRFSSLAGFVAVTAVWLAISGKLSLAELTAASCAAAVSIALMRPIPALPSAYELWKQLTLRRLWRIVKRSARELFVLVAALMRHIFRQRRVCGTFVWRRIQLTPHATSLRAQTVVTTFTDSFSPNEYVLGLSVERSALLVHRLVHEDRSQ